MKIFAIIVGLYLSASAMAQQSATTTFEVSLITLHLVRLKF